jgi:phage tail-like protein
VTADPRQDGFLDIEFQGNVVRRQALNFDVLRIGRSPDNDLPLQHPGISREHLELRLTPSGMVATDLNSSNGTFVDGVRMLAYQPTSIELGQVLQIGPYVLVTRRTLLDRPDGIYPVGNGANGRARGALNGAADGNLMTIAPIYPRRPTLPVHEPQGRLSKYLDYLPAIFSENDFLGRFLLIFESIWEPFEQRQDHMAMYFDPATCPESFLAWLADWYQMPIDKHWPEARTRSLVAEMTELFRFRGTTYGLAKMIEIWTGIAPEIVEDPKQPFVFTVRLQVPSGAQVDREVVEDLLKAHKPAASGYVLEIVS